MSEIVSGSNLYDRDSVVLGASVVENDEGGNAE